MALLAASSLILPTLARILVKGLHVPIHEIIHYERRRFLFMQKIVRTMLSHHPFYRCGDFVSVVGRVLHTAIHFVYLVEWDHLHGRQSPVICISSSSNADLTIEQYNGGSTEKRGKHMGCHIDTDTPSTPVACVSITSTEDKALPLKLPPMTTKKKTRLCTVAAT